MGLCVCGGGIITCTFGMAPSVFNVLPENKVVTAQPIANIMDNKPMINIMPFGMCSCPSNPAVATATSAALGALTPMPCIPATAEPWAPGSPSVLIGSYPALNNESKLMCSYGGIIQVSNAGQMNIQIG